MSSTPLDRFTLFPELPIELRLVIWNLALPTPPHAARLKETKSLFSPSSPDLMFKDARYPQNLAGSAHHIYISDLPVLPLLHTCREARQEALKNHPPDIHGSLDPKHFGSLTTDTLFLDCESWNMCSFTNLAVRFNGFHTSTTIGLCQYLCDCLDALSRTSHFTGDNLSSLKAKMPSVRTVICTPHRSGRRCDSGFGYHETFTKKHIETALGVEYKKSGFGGYEPVQVMFAIENQEWQQEEKFRTPSTYLELVRKPKLT